MSPFTSYQGGQTGAAAGSLERTHSSALLFRARLDSPPSNKCWPVAGETPGAVEAPGPLTLDEC